MRNSTLIHVSLIALIFYGSVLSVKNLQAEISFESHEDLSQFMMGYHEHPAPERIDSAINFLATQELKTNMIPPLIGFFSVVFHRHMNYREAWQEKVHKLDGKLQAILLFCMKTHPTDLWIRQTPTGNDICWSAYFASGNLQFLERIFMHARYVENRVDLTLYLTGSSAQWSFATNARQYKGVREYLFIKYHEQPEDLFIQELLHKEPAYFKKKSIQTIRSQQAKGIWGQTEIEKFQKARQAEIEKFWK